MEVLVIKMTYFMIFDQCLTFLSISANFFYQMFDDFQQCFYVVGQFFTQF